MCAELPNLVVIGAMKCGTTALHRYLDAHPEIGMSAMKETNFFVGPEFRDEEPEPWWRGGQWHRGIDWYASLFDPAKPVRGETSPSYTSPDHPQVPGRMAKVVPDARLVYLVRDPLDRALSQYQHHVGDGAEHRSVGEALLDPESQYLSRSRYHDRLVPFLELFDPSQVLVVVQERLLRDRRPTLRRIYDHVGADPHWWADELAEPWHVGPPLPELPGDVRKSFIEALADDVTRLRELLDDDLPEWAAHARA